MYNKFVSKTIQELFVEKYNEYEQRHTQEDISTNTTVNVFIINSTIPNTEELINDIMKCCRI